MLDDRDIFAGDALAALRDQRQDAEIGDRGAVMPHRRDGDDCEIQLRASVESLEGREGEDPAAPLDEVQVQLVFELGEAAARGFRIGQHVVVGHEQCRCRHSRSHSLGDRRLCRAPDRA